MKIIVSHFIVIQLIPSNFNQKQESDGEFACSFSQSCFQLPQLVSALGFLKVAINTGKLTVRMTIHQNGDRGLRISINQAQARTLHLLPPGCQKRSSGELAGTEQLMAPQ